VDTLEYIGRKFELDFSQKSPIPIYKINREIMAQTLAELNLNLGVEVGVHRGLHAEILCKNNPNIKLYGIDAWQKYSGYHDYSEANISHAHREAIQRLAPYNCELIEEFSMDAVQNFKTQSLDFVYIDGAHDFKNVAMDIFEWTRRVRIGGVVYGHDFKRSKGNYLNAVKDVVPAYIYQYGIRPWFILGQTGHNDGLYREGMQSWMFVRSKSNDNRSVYSSDE
jgi:predicted O-methyltransferase YrrM